MFGVIKVTDILTLKWFQKFPIISRDSLDSLDSLDHTKYQQPSSIFSGLGVKKIGRFMLPYAERFPLPDYSTAVDTEYCGDW